MEFSSLMKVLGAAPAMAAVDLDLANDVILVLDASEPRQKLKRVAPSALADALKAQGGASVAIPLMTCRTATGIGMTAAAGAGVFGVTLNPGVSLVLTGEVATSGTKTDKLVAEIDLPSNYVAGRDLTLVINAKETGVATVKTIDASAWETSTIGAASADLVTTNAQNLGLADGDFAFTISGAALLPGDRLLIQVTTVITEAAAAAANASIASLRLTL